MKRRKYTVTIQLEVWDGKQLYRAASARAKRDGLSKKEYDVDRKDTDRPQASDLIMMLDPGSLSGCNIIGSSVEED